MNKFIKLIINTVYGDIVSPYFQLGNTIVGNNITGRARAMAWYMEKALHGIQTITDRRCFELNRVVKLRYVLTNIKYNRIRRLGKQKDLTLGPLLERKIRNQDRPYLDLEKIAIKTNEHIQKTFPRTNIIAKYELEVKKIVTGLSTHGASKYQTRIDDKITNTKMRSYKNKKYIIYDPKTKKIKGEKNTIESWLNFIYKNPNKVYREEPFVEKNIIKTNDYKKQMFEPLIKVFIHPTRQIKLRFRYKLPNLQVKVLIFFLQMKFIQPNQLTSYDFLYSIMEELLKPFLLIQNQTVISEAVSIIYPQKKTFKYDLLKLPLFNVKGVIPGRELQERFRTLNVSIRFEGRPMPCNIKVYGIN
uniref:DNA-directed DNA polymerase n=1 Tax=Rhodomela confervoides TaxID=35163 RepID=A0A1Z1M9A6_RHOCN|nr:hypothetical protein [Rhodomela confervoides]ARW62687.1 hypothetical protein [Rhodomela confervoides]